MSLTEERSIDVKPEQFPNILNIDNQQLMN